MCSIEQMQRKTSKHFQSYSIIQYLEAALHSTIEVSNWPVRDRAALANLNPCTPSTTRAALSSEGGALRVCHSVACNLQHCCGKTTASADTAIGICIAPSAGALSVWKCACVMCGGGCGAGAKLGIPAWCKTHGSLGLIH